MNCVSIAFSRNWMFVPSKNVYVQILISNVTVFWGGALGRWVGHEGGALTNGISAHIKLTPESSLSPSTTWEHSKKIAVCEAGSNLSLDTESAGTLVLDFQPPALGEINFCCLYAT